MSSDSAARQSLGDPNPDTQHGRTTLRTVTVRDFDGLLSHWAAWNKLAENTPLAVPPLMPAWVDAYMRNRVEPNEQWFCSFAYANDELIGMLPIVVSPHAILRHQRPLLKSLGSGNMSPSGNILLDPDHAAIALPALLAEISREVPGHLGLHLRAVQQDSPLWNALVRNASGYARYVYRERTYPYSYIDVHGGHDDYMSNLGNMRRNLKRYLRKLETHGAVSIEIRSGPDAGEDFLAEFLALEASGWKGRNGTAILNDSKLVAFCKTLVRSLSAQQRLEWHIIRVQDHLVAAEMGIRCGESLMLPKIAFDEAFADSMPGNLLTAEVIRDAFARPGLSKIIHMSDADWHKSWRMSQSQHGDVHLVRRSSAALIFYLPSVLFKRLYQHHIHPRIPAGVKRVRENLRRKAVRAAKAARLREPA